MQTNQEMFELAARARLMEELTGDGVTVAVPIGGGEIDMLASLEAPNPGSSDGWIPIKVLATSADRLGNQLEGTRVPGLLVMLISGSGNFEPVQTFALTSAELTVARMVALIARNSAESDCYTSAAGRITDGIFKHALEPFAISPGQWRQKLMAALESAGGRCSSR